MTDDRFTVGVSEWTLHESSIVKAIERVARAGYPAIELSARSEAGSASVRKALASTGLEVVSLCNVYDLERDCSHADARRRRAASEYIRTSLELAGELGAATLVVVPTYRVDENIDREQELARAAETIASAAEGLAGDGPVVAIEALNRYETHLIRTLEEADDLRRRVGSPRVRIMADVFHMNIEEDDVEASLRRFGSSLVHVHLADNQRRAPGSGSLAFRPLLSALEETGYRNALVMEFEPTDDDALEAGLRAVPPRRP